MSLPDTKEQILQSHSGLIHRVVMHCNNPGTVPDLEQVLQMASENDWTTLVTVIRDIMSGNRDEAMLQLLDDDDRVIAESILRGLQDPNTLPALETNISSDMAAPGIAGLIHASRSGNAQALQIVGNMAKQMLEAGDRIRADKDLKNKQTPPAKTTANAVSTNFLVSTHVVVEQAQE